jgi:DNA-binding CsgD family transcriptional regulator/tetratricopeptide (TPR) repeat protein
VGAGPVSPVLIGRDELVEVARRRWHAVRADGAGHLLFLAGEAGIGKTRLLAEISREVAADGAAVVVAAAFPRDAEVAGGVLDELAAELRRAQRPELAGAAERMLTALRLEPGPGGDAHRRRRLLITELTDALASLAGREPLLVAIEDLHWVDDLTLEVIGRLARRLNTLPLLLVGTYRSDQLYPRVPMREWRTRLLTARHAEEVRLARLDYEQTAALVAAIVHNGQIMPRSLVATVFDRSDGIPLHIEELLGAHDAAGLPDTLAEAVLSRARQLDAGAVELAGAAAAIGRRFDAGLLAAVADAPPAEVDSGLRVLLERFFISACSEPGTFTFRHALIRDALYGDLAPLRRRALHGRAARAAASAGMSDAFISGQYELAGEAALAHQHALTGGDAATAVSAHREAVDLYRRGQRTMPTDTLPLERAALLAKLAAALAAVDDNSAAAVAYEEAMALLTGLGEVTAAVALVPSYVAVRHLLGADLSERTGRLRDALCLASTVELQVRLLAALSAAYMLDRRLDEALEYGQRARALATTDAAARLNTETSVGSVLLFAGAMDEGWRLLESATIGARTAGIEAEAARAYRMIGSCASALVEYERGTRWLTEGAEYAERTERWNDHHYMLAHLAHVRWAVGEWDMAQRLARRALADGAGSVTTRITALYVTGYLALGRTQWTDAVAALTEARVLGEEMNELQRLSPALWGLAEVALRRGDFDEAIALCDRGYAASAAVGDAAYLFPYLVTGVKARLGAGRVAAAGEWADRAGALVRERGIPGTLPAVDHAEGLLLLAAGQTGPAGAALERAVHGWSSRHRFWESVQAQQDLAQCTQRSRRLAEASALRSAARDRALATGAEALIDATEPAGASSALSVREVEVARLIATGATNRQIAASLYIAPKTVAAHIEHILTKLGASRRAEIAAWVTVHLRDA